MAEITSYVDLYPLIVPELPSCPEPLILQALKKTARKFCQDTNAWREQLASIDLKENILNYALASAWDAEIKEIIEVRINSEVVDLAGADLSSPAVTGATSIAVHGIVSADGTIASNDDFIVVGGDGTLYTVRADATITAHAATVLFTPALTQDVVAGAKLAVVPAKDLGALVGKSLYIYAAEDTTRLGVPQGCGTLSLDVSLTPSEDVIRGLDVKVSVVPELNTDDKEMDMNFLVRWVEAIIGGTIFWLMTMKGRKWTDMQRAPLFLLDYNRGVSRARREIVGGYKVEIEDLSA